MGTEKLLLTGAKGQIGTVLTQILRQRYGADKVIATDLVQPNGHPDDFYEVLDVLDKDHLESLIRKHQITQVYHLAAILSAKGEQNPIPAWSVNMQGLFNVLDLAKEYGFKVFFPSSIAVLGSESPKFDTPQFLSTSPETVYGISKVAGEYWAKYYHHKYGVDVRSLRYPGIISHQSLPGGGTTDYAVEIFHEALKEGRYKCFLSEETRLPMMYIPDAIRATIELMEADAAHITVRTSYNLAGFSVTPAELYEEIKLFIPEFEISYSPDFRQDIANSWTSTIDDSAARKDWGWKEEYDLKSMTKDMIRNLSGRYSAVKA